MIKPFENLKADVRDIMDVTRKIVNRHVSSVRELLRGGLRVGLLRR